MESKQSSLTSIERIDSVPSGVGAALGENPCTPDDEPSRAIRISLQLEGRDLPNLDTRGKSDPFVIIYRKVDNSNSNTEDWVKIGQTETVYNNLNPKWSTTFAVDYCFGTTTVLRFSVYDRDSKDEDLSKHDYIGDVRCTVAQVVLADNQRLVLQINNKNAKPGTRTGTLTIRGEEQKGDLGDNVTFQFIVTGLRNGRKPFYVLSNKNRNDYDFSPVVYSEVHQAYAGANHRTKFKPITTSLARLTNGDMDRELEVQFMDYDRRGNHYRGGKVRFTLRAANAAVANSSSARFQLRKRKTNGQVVEAGELILNKCEISVPFSFIDYISSGVEINTMIAVDMSSTNGNPADPKSLQFRGAENEYVNALREVGSVIAVYDTSKTFPAFGFGACQRPHWNEIDHCFPLTLNRNDPICNGIEGVIENYQKALNNVAPFEPCRYGPVLKHVIEKTRESNARHGEVVYTILVLVTDGDFADFADVANLICDCAELPLSIVIVGVGNSRFLKLEKLDGDNERLCSTEGIPCARDIVQFVQFHKHRYNPTQLAREVLDEIPEQLVSYMRSKGLTPADIIPLRNTRLQPPGSEKGPYLPEPVPTSHAVPLQPAPNFPPAVAVSMASDSLRIPSIYQPQVQLQRPPGVPSQTNGVTLPQTPCSGAELIPPPPSLNQPPVSSQGTQQSGVSSHANIYPQFPYPQSALLDQSSHSHMLCPPSSYPPGYGDQAAFQQTQPQKLPNLQQQLHPLPSHGQEQHTHSQQYHPSQHPIQQNRLLGYQPHLDPYTHSNGNYASPYPQAPPSDLTASYTQYSVPAEQNVSYQLGSMPFPPHGMPPAYQQGGPSYPPR